MKIFDFFGVAPVGAGSEHAWAGITRMKEGFGGRRERFVGAYDLVVRSYWYGLWKFVQKVKLAWPKF